MYFDLRGIVVSVAADSEAVRDAVRRRLARHLRSAPAVVELSFEYVSAMPLGMVQGGRTVYESSLGAVRYSEDDDALRLVGDGFAFECACAAGRSRASIAPGTARADWLASRPFLTLALLETLRRRGLYGLHAAAVAREGAAVVIAGASGVGKTTLAVALGLHGFAFMGDDLVLLDKRSSSLAVGALCEELDLTSWTAERLPGRIAGVPANGWPKLRVDPGPLFREATVDGAAPAIIIFPRVGRGDRLPEARLISAEDAVLRLAPDLLLTERATVAAHLAAVNDLVSASRSYELTVTADVDAVVATVSGLL